jgi:hypothetical protein
VEKMMKCSLSNKDQNRLNPSDEFHATQETEPNKKNRRSALRKIGKYSAYALPALLAMSARAVVSSNPG